MIFPSINMRIKCALSVSLIFLLMPSISMGASKSKQDKEKTKIINKTANKQKPNLNSAIAGKFYSVSRSDSYGYEIRLIPAEENMDKFPLLKQSDPIKYFEFVSYNTNDIANTSVTNISKYDWVIGFSEEYNKIKGYDQYQLQENKSNIVNKLVSAHRAYKAEYDKYLKSIFKIELSNIEVGESEYNIDNQLQTITIDFTSIMPGGTGNSSDPGEMVLYDFKKVNGFKLIDECCGYRDKRIKFHLPLKSAKEYYTRYNLEKPIGANNGMRTGKSKILMWVSPKQYNNNRGTRIGITGMDLLKATIVLDNTDTTISLY